jgi:hypothetical protein
VGLDPGIGEEVGHGNGLTPTELIEGPEAIRL